MRHIILVRHGESDLNARNRLQKVFCGQFDTPLTERGREQARSVGRQLAARRDLQIQVAVSSALARARETLDLILEQLAGRPRTLPATPDLNERSLGLFEGRLEEEVWREFPEYQSDPRFCRFRDDFEQKAPGGESLHDVTQRAWPAFEQVLAQTSGDLLLVSHFNTLRCLLTRALRLPPTGTVELQIRNAVPYVLRYDSSQEERFRFEGELPLRASHPRVVPGVGG